MTPLQYAASPTAAPTNRYPKPTGRVVVVDWWKGFSIFLMLFAHYFGKGLEDFGQSIDGGAFIPIGIVQLCNGLFFFLSSFGNYISLQKMLARQLPLTTIALIVVLRAVILVALSMLTIAIFHHWISVNLYREHYYRGVDADPLYSEGYRRGGAGEGGYRATSPEHYSTTLVDQLFDPSVVPYIGINTALSSLVALLVTGYARQQSKVTDTSHAGGATGGTTGGTTGGAHHSPTSVILRFKLKLFGLVAVLVLVLNVPLRAILDRATYTVGFDCDPHMYNQTQIETDVPARFPDQCYVTHSPTLDFSDNPRFNPCPSNTDAATHTVSPAALPGFITALNDSHARCVAFLTNHKAKLPTTALAHTNDAERGYRWCPTNVTRDALVPTAAEMLTPTLERCTLVPWWTPPAGVNGMGTMEAWSRLTPAQRAYNLFTWPWLGRYGYFAYGANSLLGTAVAMYVCDAKNGGWTPELFAALYKIAFFAILIGMGPALALFIVDSGGNETAQMASTWMRLLFGGIELMAFTIFANVMEGRPNSGCRGCCGGGGSGGGGSNGGNGNDDNGNDAPTPQAPPRQCCNSCRCCPYGCLGAPQFVHHWFYRMSRRYGAVSLTVFVVQDFTFHTTSLTLNALGGYAPPFCVGPMYADDSLCGRATVSGQTRTNLGVTSLYVCVNLVLFTTFVWLWQRVHFVGSFEWMIQKILTSARGTKSTSITVQFQHHEGGDCTCRGCYSHECCNVKRFCCGACENTRRRKQPDGRGLREIEEDTSGGVGHIDCVVGGEEVEVKEVECTGSVAVWGCRAGIIASLIILGIIGGAQ